MTEERKIITREQFLDSVELFFISRERRKDVFDDLQDAPKHTDEEYDKLWNMWEAFGWDKVKLEARIKELEVKERFVREYYEIEFANWLLLAPN